MSTSNTEAKDGSNEVKVEVPLSKQPSKVFVQKSENTGVSAAKETKQKKEMVMISPQQLTTHTKDDLVVEDMAIRVVVRKRPLSKGEENKGDKDIIEVRKNGVVMVHEPKTKVDLTKVIETQTFIFDDAFDSNDSNEEIYSRTIKHLVDFVFRDKGKASCFAYGQTGSGKVR